MILLQAFSLILIMSWLWNLKSQVIQWSEPCELNPKNEKDFLSMIPKLAMYFLNFTSPKNSLEKIESDLWKNKTPRIQLLLLGAHQLSFISFVFFIYLFMKLNILFFIGPVLLLVALSKFFCRQKYLTDWFIALMVMVFLIEPTLRLFSRVFNQPDPSTIWFFFTHVSFLNLAVALVSGAAIAWIFEKLFGWNFVVSIFAVILVLSYQMSLVVGLFMILGERLASLAPQLMFLKRAGVSYLKRFAAVQILGLVIAMISILSSVGTNPQEVDLRIDLLCGFYLVIQFIFFLVTMIFGHFQNLTETLKTKG